MNKTTALLDTSRPAAVRRPFRLVGGVILTLTAAAGITPARAQVPNNAPTYIRTFLDAVTGDAATTRTTDATNAADGNFNAFGNGGRFTSSTGQVTFDIDQFQPGSTTQRADSYLTETYERPTDQTFLNTADSGGNTRFALQNGVKYYAYLDITQTRVGFDSSFLYVSMDLNGLSSFNVGNGLSNNENSLKGFYGFRIGENLANPQSRGGYFIRFQEPTSNATSTFDLDPTASIYRDVNNNVGGNSINGTVASTNEGGDIGGDGYEVQVAADGRTNGSGGFSSGINVLYTRTSGARVDFALRYATFGFSVADLESSSLFLMFQATEVRNDASDPFFNDKVNYQGAGTPNPDLRGVAGPSSTYLDAGLSGNIYRLDTLQGGAISAVPEPGSWALLLTAGLPFAAFQRKRRGSV